MSHDQWSAVWDLFHSALEQPADERDNWLRQHCSDNNVREEVQSLLAASDSEDNPLDGSLSELLPSEFTQQDGIPDRIGAYRILDRIGQGGMADVYTGERIDGTLNKNVAIKIATGARYSPALHQQFLAERQILSDLSHRNIARLHDGGVTDNGMPYLIMEKIEGQSIIDYCESQRLPLRQRLNLMMQLCSAVSYAHQKLVLHRDIKPGNVLVNDEGNVKLLDFGVAKLLENPSPSEVTQLYGKIFTPDYASPEQFSGTSLTTASDVYSLGVLMYRLLTGSAPYRTDPDNIQSTIDTVCHTIPALPSRSINPEGVIAAIHGRNGNILKGDLDQIILKAMEKDPAKRYETVSELNQDIDRYLQGHAVVARGQSAGYRLVKFVSRHPLATGSGLLAVVVLGLFAWSMAWQADRLRTALTKADLEARNSSEVTTFLTSLFDTADPTETSVSDITLSHVIDTGIERIESELDDQPQTKATLLLTLGKLETNLNHFDSARQLLTQAADIQSHLNGPDDLNTIDANIHLSRLSFGQSRFDEARSGYDDAIQRLEAGTPADQSDQDQNDRRNRLLILAHNGLASTLQQLGELSNAEQHVSTALTLFDSIADPDPDELADTHVVLGSILWSQGRYSEATSPYQSAYTTLASRYGEAHYKSLRARSAYATLLLRNGRYAEAEATWQSVLEHARPLLGDDHAFIADATNKLGALKIEMGDLGAADDYLTESLAILTRIHGDEPSTNLGNVMSNLALVKKDLIQYEQALQLYQEALAVHRQLFGEQHSRIATQLNNIGLILYEQHQLDEAEDYFINAQEMLVPLIGDSHPNLAYSLNNLANVYFYQDKYSQAEIIARKGLKLRESGLPSDSAVIASSLTTLGSILVRQGRFDEAGVALERALDIRTAQLHPEDWRLGLSLHWLAMVHHASGRPNDAVTELMEAERLISQHYGDDHWRTREVRQSITAASASVDGSL